MTDCPAERHDRETDYINHGCICPAARNEHRKRRKYRALYMLENGPMMRPALRTCLLLRALTAIGYSGRDIAAHSPRLTAAHVNQLRSHDDKMVTPRTADEVERLYRLLSGTPGTNLRAMSHARRLGYLDPLALESDDAAPVIDRVAIERALRGERVPLTPDEKAHAVEIGQRRGMLPNHIAVALHMSGDRVRRYLDGVAPKKRGPKKQVAA